ncbi:MAG: hypothetical protein QM723_27895 [Myxococcaceae bacterium]
MTRALLVAALALAACGGTAPAGGNTDGGPGTDAGTATRHRFPEVTRQADGSYLRGMVTVMQSLADGAPYSALVVQFTRYDSDPYAAYDCQRHPIAGATCELCTISGDAQPAQRGLDPGLITASSAAEVWSVQTDGGYGINQISGRSLSGGEMVNVSGAPNALVPGFNASAVMPRPLTVVSPAATAGAVLSLGSPFTVSWQGEADEVHLQLFGGLRLLTCDVDPGSQQVTLPATLTSQLVPGVYALNVVPQGRVITHAGNDWPVSVITSRDDTTPWTIDLTVR